MRSEADHNLLLSIFEEMQGLKKALISQDERRIDIKEFAQRLGLSEPTVWDRIKCGIIEKPEKDGRLNFWLNSYVNYAVANCKKSDKVAA